MQLNKYYNNITVQTLLFTSLSYIVIQLCYFALRKLLHLQSLYKISTFNRQRIFNTRINQRLKHKISIKENFHQSKEVIKTSQYNKVYK